MQTSKFVATEEKPVSAKIIRNVLFSGLRNLILWPIPFLLVPFVLKKVGVSEYGTWAVFVAIINLTSLIDLGVGGTLTKHVAEYYAKRDFKALKRLLDTGQMLYAMLGLSVIVVLWAISPILFPLLFRKVSTPALELRALWNGLLLIIGANILAMPLYSVVYGLQRMDLSSLLGSLYTLSGALFTVLFLLSGWRLEGLLYANLFAALISLLLLFAIVEKLLPEIAINPFGFDWGEMKAIFSFGLQIYLTQTAGVIQNQVEKLYLAWFAGVIPVGWYHIASQAALTVRRVPELLLTPIMAAASELAAKGDQRRLSELHYRSHKYLALVGVPLVIFVAAASRRFVQLWLGPNLTLIALPMTGLVLVNFLNLITGPGWLILVGKGYLKPGVASTAVGIFLIVFLSLPLIYLYGFSGAVIGVLLAVIVATALFLYLFHRHTRTPYGKVVREAYLKPVACSLMALVVAYFIHLPGDPGWTGLILQGMVFGFSYVFGLLLTRFFDLFDLAQLEAFLPMARVVRKVIPVS